MHSLTLLGSFATFVHSDDTPWMPTVEERQATNVLIGEYWGTGRVLASFLPPDQRSESDLEKLAALETGGASPGAVVRLMEMDLGIDVRAVLPAIIGTHPRRAREPGQHRAVPRAASTSPGTSPAPASSPSTSTRTWPRVSGPIVDWLDDFEEFVTGIRPVAFTERVLSTVLCTDIVDSTAARVDRRRRVEAAPRPPRPARRAARSSATAASR